MEFWTVATVGSGWVEILGPDVEGFLHLDRVDVCLGELFFPFFSACLRMGG
jgi:hypothetical protein